MSTRETILKTAGDLVQTKSYSGFGFQELAETVGIRKASVYHHFESKEALVSELVTGRREQIEELFAQLSTLPGKKRLRSFLSEIGRHIGVGDKICPGAALIANWDSLSPELKKAATRLQDTYMKGFVEIVDAGRKDGTIRGDMPAEALAKLIFANLQGAIMLSRVSGNRDDYNIVMKSLLQIVSTGSNNA